MPAIVMQLTQDEINALYKKLQQMTKTQMRYIENSAIAKLYNALEIEIKDE